jgi:hypothetical protein
MPSRLLASAACRHCSRWRVLYPRGLCWRCYQTDAIRSQYLDHRQVGVGVQAPKGSTEPTAALPATADKVAVLIARAAAGQPLWHPDDACRNLD